MADQISDLLKLDAISMDKGQTFQDLHEQCEADKHVRILWRAQEAGSETVKNVADRINLIDQLVSQKIVDEETRRGWKGRVEDEPIAA